jgi:hypothetical protein
MPTSKKKPAPAPATGHLRYAPSLDPVLLIDGKLGVLAYAAASGPGYAGIQVWGEFEPRVLPYTELERVKDTWRQLGAPPFPKLPTNHSEFMTALRWAHFGGFSDGD